MKYVWQHTGWPGLKWRGKIKGLLRAGVAHSHFVTIHPFDDGNGRNVSYSLV